MGGRNGEREEMRCSTDQQWCSANASVGGPSKCQWMQLTCQQEVGGTVLGGSTEYMYGGLGIGFSGVVL